MVTMQDPNGDDNYSQLMNQLNQADFLSGLIISISALVAVAALVRPCV